LRRQLSIALLLLLGLPCAPASAQVYGGVTSTGSILLSSNLQDEATDVVVEAPPLPPAIAKTASLEAAPMPGMQAFAPFIQEASLAYKLPPALIHAVISVESNFNPRAVSARGAQGLMQLMPATAKRFGGGNSFDPRENILTGSRYLRWLMDYFNQDLELTVAAYNAGEMAVMQAGRRIPNFGETRRYVPRVLALYKKGVRLT
jgi:soluble lytic murein transglycosylase-like protein